MRQTTQQKLSLAIRDHIRARGGETSIVGRCDTEVDMREYAPRKKLILLAAEGWRQYSRAYGARRARLAYLGGRDDSGIWAVRIPGTVTSIRAALAWLTPRAVREAQARGVRVIRQGDVYFVECSRGRDEYFGTTLPSNHSWAPGRWAMHTDHSPEQIAFPCRIYRQRPYQMGRNKRALRANGGD